MFSNIKHQTDVFLSSLKVRTIEPELWSIIHDSMKAKGAKVLRLLAVGYVLSFILLVLLLGVGLIKYTDSDVAIQLVALPCQAVSHIYASSFVAKAKQIDTWGIFLMFSLMTAGGLEIMITAPPLTKFMLFGSALQGLNFLFKLCLTNKHSRLVALLGVTAYLSLRMMYEFGTDNLLQDIWPTIIFVLLHYMLFELDEDVNNLLSKRFHQTQQKWLQSLESMPVGVMIFNTKLN